MARWHETRVIKSSSPGHQSCQWDFAKFHNTQTRPRLSQYMWNWDTCPLAYVSLMTKLPSLPTSSRTNVPISCLLTVFWYPFSKVSKHIHWCESLAGAFEAFYEHCELSRKVPLATQLLIPTTTEHPWKPSARPLNQPDPGHQQPLSLSQFDTKAGSLGLGCWGKSWRNSLLHFKTKRLPVALSVRENYYQSSWSCSIISQGKNIFHLKCKVNCQAKLYQRYI